MDTNVLIDLLTDSSWTEWVLDRMAEVSGEEFAINPIIYAEISVSYSHEADLNGDLRDMDFKRLDLPWEAAFAAGKAYESYKRRGGVKTSPLPDFYIGAHAMVAGLKLLTRDGRRYRTYFPDVELIAPD